MTMARTTECVGVPPCVGRYFEFALGTDPRVIGRAQLRFTGMFAARPNAWAPFTAKQMITPVPPAFVWDARIRMMGVIPVHVRDAYTNGHGGTRASIASVLTIVDQHDTPEIAAASLQRFLAEAVWVPTALLPRKGLVWSAIDDTTARVTLTDHGTSVSLDMKFGARGEIERASGIRYRAVKGTSVLTPWTGEHRDYERVDGMMIPTSGEVAWLLPEGPVPYWRGRLVEVRYDR